MKIIENHFAKVPESTNAVYNLYRKSTKGEFHEKDRKFSEIQKYILEN